MSSSELGITPGVGAPTAFQRLPGQPTPAKKGTPPFLPLTAWGRLGGARGDGALVAPGPTPVKHNSYRSRDLPLGRCAKLSSDYITITYGATLARWLTPLGGVLELLQPGLQLGARIRKAVEGLSLTLFG